MSSIAEQYTEDDKKQEREQQFECQGSLLGGSIINLEQPKSEIDKPLQIEITDEIPKKPHHKRAVSNPNTADLVIPPMNDD